MFAHLDDIAVLVGMKLEKGDIVGEIGSTGYSPLGAHLHNSLFEKGETEYYAKNAVDPKDYFKEYGTPSRTVLTNPYGSKDFNNTKDSTLTKHEGEDRSSHILL